MSKSKNGFIVLLLTIGEPQPIFREEDELMFFDTQEEAQAEIDDCVNDTIEAFNKGDMHEPYSQDDYTVIPAQLIDNRIFATYEGIEYSMDRSDDDWWAIPAIL